jgi:hypothetical protein
MTFDPGAVPPDPDPAGSPGDLDAALAAARALLDGLRPATKQNVKRLLEKDALEAAALLGQHDPGYIYELKEELRPLKVLAEWQGGAWRAAKALKKAATEAQRSAIEHRLREFNEAYGCCYFGAKFALVREVLTATGWEPEFIAPRDVAYYHAPEIVEGEPVFSQWMAWRERNRFDGGVTFEPGVSFRTGPRPIQQGGAYNAWQGYAYEPKDGECGPILDHVRDVWCSGLDEHYEAVMNHLAGMVQNPGLAGLPLLALVSEKEGAGKNIIVEEIFLPLYGTHGIVLDRPEALTGRFNSHLGWCAFAYVNEAIWGGDRQREGAYKTLFVDKWRPLEKKFRDIIMVRNFTKGILASNEAWFAPISVRDRRHLVPEMSGHRVGDIPYFKALAKHIREGGREAFLAKLLAREVDFDMLRQPPDLRSPAKAEAMMRSAGTIDRFLHEILSIGEIPRDGFSTGQWETHQIGVARSLLFDAYVEWCYRHAFGRPETQTAFGRRLFVDTFRECFVDPDREVRDRMNHQRLVTIKPLPAARAAYAAALGRTDLWPEFEPAKGRRSRAKPEIRD